jgi:hypothetical protein
MQCRLGLLRMVYDFQKYDERSKKRGAAKLDPRAVPILDGHFILLR